MVELNSNRTARWHRPVLQALPAALAAELELVELHAGSAPRIAVFDLDNTLLVGDIGDAVFAQLKLQGYASQYRWIDYRKHLWSNKSVAFRNAVSAMAGLSERLVQRVTMELFLKQGQYLELDHSFIPIPYPNPVMTHLIERLRRLRYRIYVITASNEVSARLLVWKMFGIPPFDVFGVRQELSAGLLTDQIKEPVPIGEGKVEVYRKFIGESSPLITGGDSYGDIPLLRLAAREGLTIWVGEEKASFDVACRHLGNDRNCFFIQRPVNLQIDEQSPDGWETRENR